MLKIRTFSDVEALYHAAGCNCCETCKQMSAQEAKLETKVIRQDVREGEIATVDEDGRPTIVVFGDRDGVRHEMKASELAWAATSKLIDGFTKRHMAKHGGTYREALEVCFKLNPEYKRTYLGRRF